MSDGFRCPVTSMGLVVSCGLQACRYHVDYRWAHNCLLAYMQQQGVDALSPDEIAFLYRRPPGRIKKALEAALAQLRATAIEQQMSREFVVMETPRVCCVCESSVQDVPRSLRLDHHVYCSRECRDIKPPPIMALEITRGLPIAKILEWTFRHYRTLALAEEALSVPRWMLQAATMRFLKHDLDHYFERREPKALVRRTWHAPEWVDALIGRIRRQTHVGRFGPLTIDVSAVRRRLHEVLNA